MKRAVLALAAVAAVQALAAGEAGEMAVARQALRDGLWEVARTHALAAGGEEGRLAVLESYARENRWKDVLGALEGFGNPAGEGFRCYRASALLKTGNRAAARKCIEEAPFTDPSYAAAAGVVSAEIALADGRVQDAAMAIEKTGAKGPDASMLLAEALKQSGDGKAAGRIWREIAVSTNVPERVRVDAASRLGDADVLRGVYGSVGNAGLKRIAGLNLGVALLSAKGGFEEGSRTIRALVREAPDTEGAKDAFLALAAACGAGGDWSAATEIYGIAAETWPDVEGSPDFHEGGGVALLETGKADEALVSLERAATLFVDSEARARSLVRSGDALARLGRPDEATARYREVLSKFPGTQAAKWAADVVRVRDLEEKGRSLYAEYRFAEAQSAFAEVAAADPSRAADMSYFRVLCLYGQGRDEEAAAAARAIADGDGPGAVRASARLWLAKLAYNSAKWKEAVALFSSYADAAPPPPSAPAALVWAARAAFADGDYPLAVSTVARHSEKFPSSPEKAAGMLVQGEALIEQARFEEAALVLERAALLSGPQSAERFRAQLLKADALFAMGADNPARYAAALETYRALLLGEALTPSERISLSYKIGKVLEKTGRMDEAADQYYTQVVLAYRDGREKGFKYDEGARADFSRAAFALSEDFESRGRDDQAEKILSLVVASGVPAAAEAGRRIERIRRKGKFL